MTRCVKPYGLKDFSSAVIIVLAKPSSSHRTVEQQWLVSLNEVYCQSQPFSLIQKDTFLYSPRKVMGSDAGVYQASIDSVSNREFLPNFPGTLDMITQPGGELDQSRLYRVW